MWIASPRSTPSGVPDGWIEAITDVTERRRTEERLGENQSTLQSFYDSSPSFMGLVELDGDSIIMVYSNRALTQVLGTTPEGIVNRQRRRVHHPGGGRPLGGEVPSRLDGRALRCSSSTSIGCRSATAG